MPSFDSPISNKKFQGSQFREFDVPDESGFEEVQPQKNTFDFSEIQRFQERVNSSADLTQKESEIRAAKEAQRNGKERLNAGAKNRIEMLIGMTRATRSVDVGGNTYVLQSLKSKEMRDALIAAAAFDGSVQFPYEVRKQFLTRSLVSISNIDINQFIGSNSFDVKCEFIDELDDALCESLYAEFLLLVDDSKKKNSIVTEQDLKGVASDLKK